MRRRPRAQQHKPREFCVSPMEHRSVTSTTLKYVFPTFLAAVADVPAMLLVRNTTLLRSCLNATNHKYLSCCFPVSSTKPLWTKIGLTRDEDVFVPTLFCATHFLTDTRTWSLLFPARELSKFSQSQYPINNRTNRPVIARKSKLQNTDQEDSNNVGLKAYDLHWTSLTH